MTAVHSASPTLICLHRFRSDGYTPRMRYCTLTAQSYNMSLPEEYPVGMPPARPFRFTVLISTLWHRNRAFLSNGSYSGEGAVLPRRREHTAPSFPLGKFSAWCPQNLCPMSQCGVTVFVYRYGVRKRYRCIVMARSHSTSTPQPRLSGTCPPRTVTALSSGTMGIVGVDRGICRRP